MSRRRLCRYYDPNRTRKMVVGSWWRRLSSGCLDEASTSRRVHTTKGARRRSKVECLSRRGSHCHDGTSRRLRGYHRAWADIGRTGKHLEGLRLNDADKEFLARAQECLAQTAVLEVKDELTGIWTDLKTRAVKAAREGRKRAAQEDGHEVQTLKHACLSGWRSLAQPRQQHVCSVRAVRGRWRTSKHPLLQNFKPEQAHTTRVLFSPRCTHPSSDSRDLRPKRPDACRGTASTVAGTAGSTCCC